jgi:hypothetical protein
VMSLSVKGSVRQWHDCEETKLNTLVGNVPADVELGREALPTLSR